MAISILTDWTLLQNETSLSATSTLPSFPAGENRVVEILVVTYHGSGNASAPTAVTANGAIAGVVLAQGVNVRLALGVFQFLESQIDSIQGQLLTSSGASGELKTVAYRVLGGCKQSPVFSSGAGYVAATGTITIPLSRAASSLSTIVAFTGTSSTSLVLGNPARDGILQLTSGWRISFGSEPDTENTSDSTVSGINRTAAIAYNREPVPTQLITNINGGNTVIPGQATTWTSTGFAPNSATLDGISCLSVSSLGFTPPGYADEANNPRPGNRLLVASEGANTASATVPVGVIPGYKYQTLASVSASLYSVVKDMDADIGDFVVYPDADGNNVTDAGELETNHEGSQVFWLIKGDTGYGLSYNVLTGPGGEIIDVIRSLTAKSLTMSGLTMRSLTARGL